MSDDLSLTSARPPANLNQLRPLLQTPEMGMLTIERGRRNAAVAMIFSMHTGELTLCFGKRAAYEGDPWSGDMAFPGGKGESVDDTFHAIAVRETFEETGLEIGRKNLIGALNPLTTHGSATRPALTVCPVIYGLTEQPRPFNISSELDEAFWIPLAHLWNPQNLTTLTYARNGAEYPGIDYRGRIIWGFTLRMLHNFATLIGTPLAHVVLHR
ncbi:MAG: NUDIX hydrolase [Candidatus Promineifilaceae bacterium]